MQISDTLLQAIAENKEALKENRLDDFFMNMLDKISTAQFTGEAYRLMLNSGIDPLDYMSFIPPYAYWKSQISNLEIPPTIKTICSCAFMNCIGQDEIILPEGLISIYSFAFVHSSFDKIYLPESLMSIDNEAFIEYDDKFSIPPTLVVKKNGKTSSYLHDYGFDRLCLIEEV